MNKKNVNKKIIVTHDGNFHTDEVFACAVLSIFHNGEIEIIRSRESSDWEKGDYVVDVGGQSDSERGLFDHHQTGGAGVRQNGTPYSSLGLVWKEFGEKITGSQFIVDRIDKRLIQPIDSGDNGIRTFETINEISPFIIQDVIASFRPGWNEERTLDEGFFEAVNVAKRILEREIIRTQKEELGKKFAEEAYEKADDKRIVILEDHYPWHEALANKPEALFVVKPDRGDHGKWKIEAIFKDLSIPFVYRKLLVRDWAGKMGTELAEVTGIPDALFCHNKLNVAVTGSKESALKMVQLAVDA